jgi:hypothetical protein
MHCVSKPHEEQPTEEGSALDTARAARQGVIRLQGRIRRKRTKK